MDDLTPTSPLVPGLGNFGTMITVPLGVVDEDRPIDPTPPTSLRHSNSASSSGRSSGSSSGSSSSRRKSHRHKDRPDSTYAGLSSRDLARILVDEELRSSHYSKLAQTLSSQLSQQKQRADDAERRATHAAGRLKEETEERIKLEQALKRKAEELKLYHAQLKKAQGEIYKAQDALAEVEKMRDEAEQDAAKARSIARKLREQRLVDIAREEGRRVGLREGLARGQEIDYVDRGYAYLEGGSAAVEEVEDDDYYSRTTTRSRHSPPHRATTTTTAPPSAPGGSGGGKAPGITDPPEERVLNPMTVTTPLRMPSPEASPKFSQPVAAPTPDPTIPVSPVSVASVGTRPMHRQGPAPPDVFIPVKNGDGIRLPPPHEFSPQITYAATLPPQPQPPTPVSPTPPPAKSPSNRSVLMVPPPTSDAHHSDRDSTASGASYSPATGRRESSHRRRRSSDSQASTTMSQMEILEPPTSERDPRLSSITEERSSAVSSAIASPNNAPSIRSLQSNPNVYQSNAASNYTPSLRVPSLDTASSLHKSSSMSSDEYKFDIVPPSRPTSNTFSDSSNNPGVTTSEYGLLSAEDAHHRPLPSFNTPPQPPSPPIAVVSEPPPGFVPFNPSPAQTNRSPLPTNPEPLDPDAGWGFSFQNLPSTHVEEPPTAPVIPTSLSSKSKQALSNVSGVTGSSRHTAPSQTATHTTGAGSRNRRPPSTTTSSDDEVSSDISSDNSLTTPPAQPRRLLTPIYGPVGLPSAAPGTGRTAPVSLPIQTPGTGRTNPVNLPPTQRSSQQQNPDGMPPPGAVGESPAPTTTTSTRGRGTGNRGKKRR